MDKVQEIWKDVVGYEGIYQVSNIGRLKNSVTNKIKSLEIDEFGYQKIKLHTPGNCKKTGIHRVVAIAFIPNPENKATVNHKDGNKLNNHVDNLEWCTHSENIKHAYRTGLLTSPFIKWNKRQRLQ